MTDNHTFMLVGPVGAGKSTLFNAIFNRKDEVRKTQALEFETGGIDTPGEFFSYPKMFSALITTSNDVDTIVYVHPCGEPEIRLPPGLLNVYAGKQLIAVISKTDCDQCKADQTEELLRNHGFDGLIFRVSINDPESIDPLRKHLLENITET